MSKVEKPENVEISAYWIICYVATATRTVCTCKLLNWCTEWRLFYFLCLAFVGTVWNAITLVLFGVSPWNKEHYIGFGVTSRKESSNKWKPILKWRWNNYVIVTSTKCFVITRALLAQSRLFVSPLRFNSQLRLEGLRPIKDIEAWYIEGCSYRNNTTVSLVRQPYEAISVDNWWPIYFHHHTVVDYSISTFKIQFTFTKRKSSILGAVLTF